MAAVPIDTWNAGGNIPGLALLRDSELLRRELACLLPPWRDFRGELRDVAVTVSHFVPGRRCVVDLDLALSGDPPRACRLIGKLYSKDQGAAAFEALVRLQSGGFGRGSWLVPEPLAYHPHWRLLLLRRTEGDLLRDALVAGRDVRPPLQAAAEWLVRLHRSTVKSTRTYTFDRHLHTMRGWKELVTAVHPETANRLSDLLRRIAARAAALPFRAAAPTHRDFSPDHIVYGRNLVTVLDFDEFCNYDPLFDVAHFGAHVRFLGWKSGGPLAYFDAASALFQTEYAVQVPECCPARLALHGAISYFKLAHIVAVKRSPDSSGMVDRLLTEALLQLSGEQK